MNYKHLQINKYIICKNITFGCLLVLVVTFVALWFVVIIIVVVIFQVQAEVHGHWERTYGGPDHGQRDHGVGGSIGGSWGK